MDGDAEGMKGWRKDGRSEGQREEKKRKDRRMQEKKNARRKNKNDVKKGREKEKEREKRDGRKEKNNTLKIIRTLALPAWLEIYHLCISLLLYQMIYSYHLFYIISLRHITNSISPITSWILTSKYISSTSFLIITLQ